MYKIRGSDQKEYGPVSVEVLRQWLAEGRVRPDTLACLEGGLEWKPLSSFTELADLFKQPEAVGPSAPTPAPLTVPTPPKTSGLAVASLICGILGCFGVTALAGLVLGFVALSAIKKSQGRLSGRGLAIGGICVSAFMLVLTLVLTIAFVVAGVRAAHTGATSTVSALGQARSKAQTINCVSHMKQIALGLRIYAVDHNDNLPPAATWCDAIQNEIGGQAAVLHCPADQPGRRSSYALNSKLGGLNVDKLDPRTVMIFESDKGWNARGGPEDMVTRHGNIYVVGFADGSVQQIPASQLSTLRWEP